MSDVKRYAPYDHIEHGTAMEEDSLGGWVKFSDYRRLRAVLDEVRGKILYVIRPYDEADRGQVYIAMVEIREILAVIAKAKEVGR